MPYKPPQPTLLAFQDPKQKDLVRRLMERITNLESVTGTQSFSNGRKSPAPAQAGLSVSTKPGTAIVRITLPQLMNPKQNAIGAPLLHWTQASTSPDFSSGVTDFGVGPHTFLSTNELGSGTFYFQVRSSIDGQTWNDPVRTSKVTIP